MKEFLKKLFITETGDFRTLPSIAWFGVLTVIGIVALGPEILYGFSDRFWRAGIFQLLGPIAGAVVAYKAISYYNKTQNAKGLLSYIGVGIVLFWAGLFGSAVGLKIDRSDSIPDVAIYWANGKVKNSTDSTKKDYYFDYVELSELDSLYV